jgi:hypothetical protein
VALWRIAPWTSLLGWTAQYAMTQRKSVMAIAPYRIIGI